jgi:hypothetical protein
MRIRQATIDDAVALAPKHKRTQGHDETTKTFPKEIRAGESAAVSGPARP